MSIVALPVADVSARRAPSDFRLYLAASAVAACALLINPVGYLGGGTDDYRYLEAARCWIDAGQPCLPASHWASRWPAVAPLSFFIWLFGESRLTIGIAPAIAWFGSLVLLGVIARQWFDRATSAVAVALLASTPALTQSALQPSIDSTELVLQLGALALAISAYRDQRALTALAAGVLAALACQARDTSYLFCGAAALAWFQLKPDRRKILLWAIVGPAAVISLEMLVYGIATGDPTYRYQLALAHGSVPSAELLASVDTRQSPIFNPAYIAGWKREADIALWWLLDPWLNLLASPRFGAILIAGAIVFPFSWRKMDRDGRRICRTILLLALLVSALQIYGLGMDPKSRIFLLLACAVAVSVAAAAVTAWRTGTGLVPATVVSLALIWGVRVLAAIPNTHAYEEQAARWIKAHPNQIESDEASRRALTLLPGASEMRELGNGRQLQIIHSPAGCDKLGTTIVGRVSGPGREELCLMRTADPLDVRGDRTS